MSKRKWTNMKAAEAEAFVLRRRGALLPAPKIRAG